MERPSRSCAIRAPWGRTGATAAAVALGLVPPAAAHAQATGALIVDRNRADRAPAQAPIAGAAAFSGGRAVAPAQAFAPFIIREVRVEGSSLPGARVGAATRPFIGRRVDARSIDALPDAVAQAYAATDVALYTIVLPRQTFAGGVVRVVAVEGRLEGVTVGGARGAAAARVRAYAERLLRDRPLRRSHLQRTLLLIGALPGLKVDAQFLPGAHAGGVRLALAVTHKPVELGFSASDRGQNLLGRTQLEADLTLNGLLRPGGRTTLTFATPTDPARFQYYAIGHSELLDGDGLSLTGSLGYLRTRPRGSDLRGEAETASLSLAYPLLLAPTRALTATLSLDGLNSRNALLGQTLTDERTRALRGALAFTAVRGHTTLAASGALSVGLDVAGARALAPGYDALDAVKFSAQARLEQTAGPWALRLRATGQVSPDLLPASEQLALGGDDFGRAFPAALVTGDDGAAGSAELGRTLKSPLRLVAQAEVYGFLDGGRVRQRSRPELALPGRTYDLASTGLGVRLALPRRTVLDLEGARALQTPDVPGSDGDWRLVAAFRSVY